MNNAILAILIVVLGVIAFCIPFFTRPRYRILEVEHKNGKVDYTVQSSSFLGLPGTWVTVKISMGYWTIVLRECDLKAAKDYVRRFENEETQKVGKRIKRKKVYAGK